MKYKVLVLVFGALLATAAFAEDVNESLDAARDGHVEIYNTSGSVEVYGSSRSSVEVTGTVGENVEELIFERDGDRINIKVKVPRGSHRNISSDLIVNVPEGSSVDVVGVSADIDVEGVEGPQNLKTVSGDVRTETSGAEINAKTVSGDVEVSGDNKAAVTIAKTISGDVELNDLSGTADAVVTSGDISVEGGSFERINIRATSGDIFYEAGLDDGGKLSIAVRVKPRLKMQLNDRATFKKYIR